MYDLKKLLEADQRGMQNCKTKEDMTNLFKGRVIIVMKGQWKNGVYVVRTQITKLIKWIYVVQIKIWLMV